MRLQGNRERRQKIRPVQLLFLRGAGSTLVGEITKVSQCVSRPLPGSRPQLADSSATGRHKAAADVKLGVAPGGDPDGAGWQLNGVMPQPWVSAVTLKSGSHLEAAIGAPDVLLLLQKFWRESRQISKHTTIARTKTKSESQSADARSAASSRPLNTPL